MKKSLRDEYIEHDSSLAPALEAISAHPFNVIGYKIVYGNYIQTKYRREHVVHTWSSFITRHRQDIGQLLEVAFIENTAKCFFFTYTTVDRYEFDVFEVRFFTKDLQLLYTYVGNSIPDHIHAKED